MSMGCFRSKRTPTGQQNGTFVSRCLLRPISVPKLTLCGTRARQHLDRISRLAEIRSLIVGNQIASDNTKQRSQYCHTLLSQGPLLLVVQSREVDCQGRPSDA